MPQIQCTGRGSGWGSLYSQKDKNTFFDVNSAENKMSIVGIIPARYASTRFPGKPLADILGKTMLQRAYEQAGKSKLLNAVVIATDDERIARHAAEIGAQCVLTGSQHPTGTDRCQEAY